MGGFRLGRDEYMIHTEGDGYGFDDVTDKSDPRVAVFDDLDTAKEQCEITDEYVVPITDEYNILYEGTTQIGDLMYDGDDLEG